MRRLAGGVAVEKRLILINSVSSVLARVLGLTVLVWLNQFLVRRIGPEEYALLPVVMAVMVFVPLLTLTLTSGVGRYVVEAYAAGDEGKVGRIVSTMCVLLAFAAVGLVLVGALVVWRVDLFLSIDPEQVPNARLMLGLLMANTAIRLPLMPFSVGFQVKQRFVLRNLIEVGFELLRIALLLVLLLTVSTRVIWVVVAEVASGIGMMIVIQVLSRRMVPELRFRRADIQWSLAGELISFGVWQLVVRLASSLRTAVDPILLSHLANPLQVACLHLGTMADRVIRQLVQRALSVTIPALIALHARGEEDKLREAYFRGGRYALLITMALAVPLILFGRLIMTLYAGEAYQLAGTVMMLSVAVYPFRYANVMFSRIAQAKAELRPLGLSQIALQTGNVLLTLYLVIELELGAIGSITGTLVTVVLGQTLVMTPMALRMVGAGWSELARRVLVPGLLPAVVTLPVLLLVGHLVEPHGWLTLGLVVAVSGPSYALVAWRCLDLEERADLRRAGAGLARRIRRRLGASGGAAP